MARYKDCDKCYHKQVCAGDTDKWNYYGECPHFISSADVEVRTRRMQQKCSSKRYCVFAKRLNGKAWTEWTSSDDLNAAMKHVEKVRGLGFLGKVTDRRKQKVITSD